MSGGNIAILIYAAVIAGGFTLLLWLPNAVLDFAADKLAEEYAHGDLPFVPAEARGGKTERGEGPSAYAARAALTGVEIAPHHKGAFR
jgi:hypothetical protein